MLTSKWDLSKANNFIDLWVTGLDEEIKSPGTSEPIEDLMSKFYDSKKKKVKKCKTTTGKCFFPFYIGIAEGSNDLSCNAFTMKDNTPNNKENPK